MEPTTLDWSLGSRAARLADWDTALDIGRRVAGAGPRVELPARAAMRDQLAAMVAQAEGAVTGFTGLEVSGFSSRAWVMGRGDWIRQNIQGLQRLLEPLADRLLERRAPSGVARKALGAQTGALLGYVSRRVLGQFDVFLPVDDDGLIYFVGPNLVEVELRYHLRTDDFRLWVAIHEVTHRVQFSSAPWLRTHLRSMVDAYLDTVSLDAGELRRQLQNAIEGLHRGDLRGPGGILLLLSPEQRVVFERMQAMMSLLEGHASFVMDEVARDLVADLPRLKRALSHRRQVAGAERTLQRAIGFDQKVQQYDRGERFVRHVVERIGMSGFNLVWGSSDSLPSSVEVADPARWIARVTG